MSRRDHSLRRAANNDATGRLAASAAYTANIDGGESRFSNPGVNRRGTT